MSLVYKDNTLSSVLIEFQELEVLKFTFTGVVNSNQSVRDFHTSSTESWFIFMKDRFVLSMFRPEHSDQNIDKTNLSFTRWNQRTQPFS